MIRSTCLAARREAPVKLLDETGKGLAAVREAVFFGGVEFSRGYAALGQEEQRVIAKSPLTTVFVDDGAVPFAFGNDRLRVVGMAHENDQRDKVGASVGLPSKVGKQLFVVAGVRLGFAGIACRINAGGTAEGFDA